MTMRTETSIPKGAEYCPGCQGGGMEQNGEDVDVCGVCNGSGYIPKGMRQQLQQAQAELCPTCFDSGEIPF